MPSILDNIAGPDYDFFVVVGQEGQPLGFYYQSNLIDPNIRAPISAGSVKVSDKVWHDWFNNPDKYRYLKGEPQLVQ